MRYKIEGGSLPVVTIELNRGESIFTQSRRNVLDERRH